MIQLEHFDRSPELAEIQAVYKSSTNSENRSRIRGPLNVVEYLRTVWNHNTLELREEFLVLCLNGSHQVIGWFVASSGGFNATTIDPRLIFSLALQTASSAIILAHNHPSGSLTPSDQDLAMTKRLTSAGEILRLPVLDHLILTKDGYFSFLEEGIL